MSVLLTISLFICIIHSFHTGDELCTEIQFNILQYHFKHTLLSFTYKLVNRSKTQRLLAGLFPKSSRAVIHLIQITVLKCSVRSTGAEAWSMQFLVHAVGQGELDLVVLQNGHCACKTNEIWSTHPIKHFHFLLISVRFQYLNRFP